MRLQTPPQLSSAPVIVDEESAIPDSVVAACQEAHKGGLLASSDYGNFIASMSEYSKPQTYAYGYGTATRPDQASGYPPYHQPSYGISYSNSHAQVPSGLPNAAEIPLLSEDSYQTHDSSNYGHQNASYSSFMPAGSRTAPEVTSFQPAQGPAGRKLFVYLNSNEDLEATGASFTVTFGSKRCEGLLTRLSNQSHQSNFALSVDVPPFDTTGSTPTQVSLYLEMADNRNPNMSTLFEFGQYTYTDATAFPLSSPSQSNLRKRKMSEEAHSPSKRPSSLNLRDSPLNNHESKITPPNTAPMVDPYSSRPQTATSNMSSYARNYNTPAHYSQSMQQTPAYRIAPTPIGMPQPQPFNSYPAYMPNERAAMAGQGQIMSGGSSNPPLVRTSALQGQGSPPGLSPSYNPYGAYPPNMKAMLKLEGDLNSMTTNWTADEVSVRRRIIRFRRAQNGSSISASFEPVTLEEHAQAPGCIYVNCIWWEEKQACFITSVDTIQLLESLVAVRFTVEEKNRIRRNLEGFRPLTVSKTRQDCEEFFKIIMGFPSPKPRNIEKDVKVFPWRILAVALKKIIGKYSASYSSTAAPLPSPVGTAPRHQLSSPPPSATSSTAPMSYPQSMTVTSMSTHQPSVSEGLNHMSGALPTLMHHHQPQQQQQHLHHHHHEQHQQQQSQPQSQQEHSQQQQQQHQQPPPPQSQISSWHQPSSNYTTDLGSLSRGSWDFSNYIETTSPPGQSQGVPHYPQRIPSISQSLGYSFMGAQEWKDFTQRTTHA